MDLQELVRDFISSPNQLSAISISTNHYYDYLALLHIILVKQEEKKGFVIPKVRNGIKICKELKLPYKSVQEIISWIVSKNNKIPENVTNTIISYFENEKKGKHVICSNDPANLTNSRVENVEEYPVCCVSSFNENKWNDLTIAYSYVDEHKKQIGKQIMFQHGHWPTEEEFAYQILALSSDELLNEIMYESQQPIMMEYIQTREKYPFIFHQACSNCISDSNSASAELNSKWSKLCQEEFPELYKKIKEGAQLDIDEKITFWSKTWNEHQDYMANAVR